MCEITTSLRIFGDDLIPREVSESLKCSPTFHKEKGKSYTRIQQGKSRIARSGLWLLSANDCSLDMFELEVDKLLDLCSDDLKVWGRLSDRYGVELFVGIFAHSPLDEFRLSKHMMKKLGERGIDLNIEINYSLGGNT